MVNKNKGSYILEKRMIIAIDGPAGAGKSTIAKRLAQKLGYTYIDSGAMYRAITLKIIKNGLSIKDIDTIVNTILHTKIDFKNNNIFLDDEEVNLQIRSDIINANVSDVSAIPEVRSLMVDMQRDISKGNSVVMDGRDVGTVIFPEAGIKLFITASVDARANRRCLEIALMDKNVNIDDIKSSIQYRDNIDVNRKTSPLKMANDAILIDTTDKSIEEVLELALSIVKDKERV